MKKQAIISVLMMCAVAGANGADCRFSPLGATLLTDSVKELKVTSVETGGLSNAFFAVGDVITGLGGVAFTNDARKALTEAIIAAQLRSGKLSLLVRRGGVGSGEGAKVDLVIKRLTDLEYGPSPFAREMGLSTKAYYDILEGLDKNPIITHMYTADPEAHIWADTNRVWLYPSHDNKPGGYEAMDGYHVFSSQDLVHWKDHGEVLHSRDVSWAAGGTMWAPDCAFKDGTYYFYFPTIGKATVPAGGGKPKGVGRVIGVATSKVPQGPFKDIGHHIDGTSWIDPACFIDDDGKAYLYFSTKKVARLKDNMIELAEPPRVIDCGEDPSIPGFEKFVKGSLHSEVGSLHFKEASGMNKINGIYYLSWNANNNKGVYAMGKSPYGPFKYGGILQSKPPGAQDHHSMVRFHGKWYYFYHVGNYIGGDSRHRNVCIDKLEFNPDATIKQVERTTLGVMVRPDK